MFRNDGSGTRTTTNRSHSRTRSIANNLFGSRGASPVPVQEKITEEEEEEDRPIRQLRPQPLAELTLQSTAKTNALKKSVAMEVRSLMPPRLQLHDTWECIYNLDQHGVSLATLYRKCHDYRDKLGERPGFVLVVQDEMGAIFGAFINEHLRPAGSYYGNGECFLYKTQVSSQGGMRFKAFPWTGLNDYQIYCTTEFLSVGGGDGKYGLWLDDRLDKGLSSGTLTFGNETLCDGVPEGRPFRVQTVEVWKV